MYQSQTHRSRLLIALNVPIDVDKNTGLIAVIDAGDRDTRTRVSAAPTRHVDLTTRNLYEMVSKSPK